MKNKINKNKLDKKMIYKEYNALRKANITQYFKVNIRDIVQSNLAGNHYSQFETNFILICGKHGQKYFIMSQTTSMKYATNVYAIIKK